MNTSTCPIPAGGICLDQQTHLFIVDIGGVMNAAQEQQRRAFVDIAAAVEFIAGRAARLSAFLAPFGQSAEAAVYGVVEEVLESTVSKSYLLHFGSTPSVAVRLDSSTHRGPYEPFRRIYPAPGPDA